MSHQLQPHLIDSHFLFLPHFFHLPSFEFQFLDRSIKLMRSQYNPSSPHSPHVQPYTPPSSPQAQNHLSSDSEIIPMDRMTKRSMTRTRMEQVTEMNLQKEEEEEG